MNVLPRILRMTDNVTNGLHCIHCHTSITCARINNTHQVRGFYRLYNCVTATE